MMSENTGENVPPQSVRIIQGSADEPSIVPARPPSSSNEGLLAVLPTGAARELATVENPKKLFKEVNKIPVSSKHEPSQDLNGASEATTSGGAKPKNKEEFEAPMDIDKIGAQKRKKIIISDDDDSGEIYTASKKSSSTKRRATRDDEEEVESIDGSAECFTAPASTIISSDERNANYNSSEQNDRTEQEERTNEEKVGKRKVGRPRKIRRQALGLVELGVKEMKSDKEEEEVEIYDKISVPTAAAMAIKWLDDVELIRAKSRNIKGDLSGQMKRRLLMSKEILKSFTRRTEYKGDKGDITLISKRNVELEAKLRLQESYQREKDKEIKILQAMLNKFKEEINTLKDKIKKLEDCKIESGSKSPKYKAKKDTYWNAKYLQSSGIDTEEEKVRRPQISPRKQLKDQVPQVENLGWEDMDTNRGEEEDKGPIQQEFPPLPKRTPREVTSKIKVLENIQLRPPLSTDGNKKKLIQDIKKGVVERRDREGKRGEVERKDREETDTDGWETVSKKRRRKKDKEKGSQKSKEINKPAAKGQNQKQKVENRRRPPRTAAVTIKGKNADFSYAEALKKARTQISLQELGIENTRIRKTVTGGILIQIPGSEGNKKAELLAEKLQSRLEDEARIALPVIKGELRIIGLDDSVTKEEVVAEIARLGECKINNIKTGDIRIMRNGLGFIWAQCPLNAAVKVAKNGKIKLGWSIVRVELLKARPKQCFKCWQFGHLRQACTSSKDYSKLCYKCGSEGHWAPKCENDPKCVICSEANREANHRIGSLACKAIQNKKEEKSMEDAKVKANSTEDAKVKAKSEKEYIQKEYIHKVSVDRIEEATMDIAND